MSDFIRTLFILSILSCILLKYYQSHLGIQYHRIHMCSIFPATPTSTKLTHFIATHNTLDGGCESLLDWYYLFIGYTLHELNRRDQGVDPHSNLYIFLGQVPGPNPQRQ
jgi:hypothetical protein